MTLRHRLSPSAWAGAIWAVWALWLTKRRLKRDGVHARVPPPPRLSAQATLGVESILQRLDATCLERALVRQRWLAAHGAPLDVIIGVPPSVEDMTAHAWVAEVEDWDSDRYLELHRLPPP